MLAAAARRLIVEAPSNPNEGAPSPRSQTCLNPNVARRHTARHDDSSVENYRLSGQAVVLHTIRAITPTPQMGNYGVEVPGSTACSRRAASR